MQEVNCCRRVLPRGGQVYSDDSWVSENVNMVQGIFDISNELGFGEGEDWVPETSVPCKHECSSELYDTRPGNWKEFNAGGDSFRAKIGENVVQVNNAKEMLSSGTQGLCQKQPFPTHFIEKDIIGKSLGAVSVERKSLTDSYKREEGSDLWILCKEFEDLEAKQMSVEGNDKNLDVKYLVSKVDDAVKFEIMLQQLWLMMKANRDDLKMAMFGNELKAEKSEPQLERFDMHQKKFQEPNHDIKVSYAEKNATPEIFETQNRTVNGALKQSSEQEEAHLEVSSDIERIVEVVSEDGEAFPNSSGKGTYSGFQDVFLLDKYRSSDSRQAFDSLLQENSTLKDFIQSEHKVSDVKGMQLNTENVIPQRHMGRISEVYLTNSTMKSQNKEYNLVGHKILELWKVEVAEHKEIHEKLKYYEAFLFQLQRECAELNSLLQEGPTENIGSTLMNFFKRLVHLQIQGPQVTKTKEIEEKNEAMWMAKERHFISEVVSFQEKVEHLQEYIEKQEANHIQEKHHWKDEIEICRRECKNKLDILQNMLKEREQKLRKESDMWSMLLEAKDEKLESMEFVVKKVVHTLKTIKKHISDLNKLITQRKSLRKDEELGRIYEGSYNCTTEAAFELQHEGGISDIEECGLEMQIFLEKLVTSIETDTHKLSAEIKEENEKMEKERNEARLLTVQAEKEMMKINAKLSETLLGMECLKEEIKTEKALFDWDRKQFETSLRIKSEEIEKLRGELHSKKQETQITAYKVHEELAMIKRELETERKERQKDRDLYLSSHQNMIKEIIGKEVVWKKQMKGLTEDFLKLKEENSNKDREIEMLREEINDMLEHFESEKIFSGATVKGAPAWM